MYRMLLILSNGKRCGPSCGIDASRNYSTHMREPGSTKFTMAEIYKATMNFSTALKIRRGGFGIIYEGQLEDGTFVGASDIDSSPKFEIWMLSMVRNYLEDQLPGALVPFFDFLIKNGKLKKESSLSSTDLFHSHSPVGFIQLSFSYNGSTCASLPVSSQSELQNLQIKKHVSPLKEKTAAGDDAGS